MGRALAVIFAGYMLISLIIMISILKGSNESVDTTVLTYENFMAYNIANSGMNLCLRQLRLNMYWRDGYSDFSLMGGTLDASLIDPGPNNDISEYGLRIVTEGHYGRATHQAVANLYRPAFCKWLYFTDYEPRIWFITGDYLDGPVHTNGTFHISGSPTFLGRVTSPNNYIGRDNPNPIFLSGANFAHAVIELPNDLSELENAARNGGIYERRTIYLDFQADGTVKKAYNSNGPWTTIDLSSINGAIWTTRYMYIKGTVHGRVTLLANYNIYIMDDIVYAQDPRENPDSTDMLGIISKRNVVVLDNEANRSDCVIHGSIMALRYSFYVQNYYSGEPRGTLYVLGGIIQRRRGAVGTFRYGEVVTGYIKNYVYDRRFLNQAPPYFPRANFYEVVNWAS